MLCENCGEKLRIQARFCPKCGTASAFASGSGGAAVKPAVVVPPPPRGRLTPSYIPLEKAREMAQEGLRDVIVLLALIAIAFAVGIGLVARPFLLSSQSLISTDRLRIGANEASAVGSIRTINTSETTYAATYPAIGFAPLASLGGAGGSPKSAGLIDQTLAGGVKSGYSFTVVIGGASGGGPSTNYTVVADPVSPGTGQRHFFSDQSGVIRCSTSGPATASSEPLQ